MTERDGTDPEARRAYGPVPPIDQVNGAPTNEAGPDTHVPREAWGVGMSDKTIRTALCPGGSERMYRLMRLIDTGRVDPTPMTTHRFDFDEIEHAFEMMKTKADGIIKPLIQFG